MNKRNLIITTLVALLLIGSIFTAVPASANSPRSLYSEEQPCLPVQGGQVCMRFIQDTLLADTTTPTSVFTATPTSTSTLVPTVANTITNTVTLTSTATPTISITQTYPFAVQTDFNFYRNSQVPLVGTISGASFQYPGVALSANTFTFNPINGWMRGSKIVYARWVLAWNPNTGSSPTGVRLVSADSSPTNIIEMARIDGSNYNTPRVDAVDITNQMQAIVDGGIWKSIGQQTYGNGANGCLIYASWIEIVWSPK